MKLTFVRLNNNNDSKKIYRIKINLFLSVVSFFLSFAGFSQAGNSRLNLEELPSVNFQSNNSRLLSSAKLILDAVAQKIKQNPDWKVVVIGHGVSSKTAQQLSWDHVNTVINYLTEKQGIGGERFIFKYGEEGDPTTVDIKVAAPGEEGPGTVPAPHPQYQSKGH